MPSKRDQSTVGDSWVVDESNHTGEEAVDKPTSANGSSQQTEGRYATRSRTSRATTPVVTSGPELVMPSMQASTTTDGSWIIPNSGTQTEDSASTQKRPLKSSNGSTSNGTSETVKQDGIQKDASNPSATSSRDQARPKPPRKILGIPITYSSLMPVFYAVFLSCMLRFLWIPKLIPYYPDICQHSLVWSTYPDACLSVETVETVEVGPSYTPPSEYQYLIDSHIRLENIVNSTAEEISQAPHLIKQTETGLRDAYDIFESSPIDAVFELELEYESAMNAIQTVRQKCDKLNLRVETTISGAPSEVRRFQRILNYAAHLDETDTGFKSLGIKYLKGLLSLNMEKSDRAVLEDQFTRHDLVLDRITSFLISDSNAILKDLAIVDEHLQAIKEIAMRENKRLGNPPCDPDSDSEAGPFAKLLKVFRAPVDSKIGSYINPKKDACGLSSDVEEESVPSALGVLREAIKPAKNLTDIFDKLVREVQVVRAEWETGSRLVQEKKQLKATD